MNRYSLTFDPNPKELARRDAAGSHVALLWSRRKHCAAVVVDDATGELVELDIRERENPLELYQRPYAYVEFPRTPGQIVPPTEGGGRLTYSNRPRQDQGGDTDGEEEESRQARDQEGQPQR